MNSSVEVSAETDRYELRLASSAAEVHDAQKLRYEVFNLELHEGLSSALATGLDSDEFDDVCDHLLVTDRESNSVVGTYRLQTGPTAARNHGYYSEREFVFAPYEPIRPQMVELGRACVAAAHRNQLVLGLLWRGIAQYASKRGARYLIGCSSLTTQDEAASMALYRELAVKCMAEPHLRTQPQPAWRCNPVGSESVPVPSVPRLMRSYLAIGCKVCSEPAIDREFGTVDYLTWLDLEALPERVLRKFFGTL